MTVSNPTRRPVELALRVVGVMLLAVLLWRQLPKRTTARTGAAPITLRMPLAVAADSSARSLIDLLRPLVVGNATPVQVELPAVPSVRARATLAAIAASADTGASLTWVDSTNARQLAVSAASTADPDGRVVVTASGMRGRPLVLADAGGVLDSITLGGASMSLLVRRSDAALTARSGSSVASIAMPTVATSRRVLLFARPGWEAKFTIAALEESGWTVDASLPVAPRTSVTVGAPAGADTARYSAVIVLDSALARVAALTRYAREGGGVIIAGDALRDRALLALSPARAGGTRAEIPGGLLSPSPVGGLEAVSLTPTSDAVVLDRDVGGAPATVVERLGGGRVAAAAYRETWRWRMEGAADGVEAHRRFWNGLVRAVAFTGVGTAADSLLAGSNAESNAAPYADLVSRLGPPVQAIVSGRRASDPVRRGHLDTFLLLASLLALVGEWASRRLRGAR